MNNKTKNEICIDNTIDEFVRYMKRIIKKKNMKKRDVFYLADIPINYGYKILLGEKKTKQRDILIRIAIAAHFTIAELQETLRLYEMPVLYKRFERDGVIIDAFKKNFESIEAFNDFLIKNKMAPLKSCGKN